jgi:hypothetical protein
MREIGIPKVLTWRWAPCGAFVLGSLSFIAFALLAIPDRIGSPEGATQSSSSLGLGDTLTPTSGSPTPVSNWASARGASAASPSPVSQVATRAMDLFPKRGFSPPLERADPPSLPAPPPGIPQPPPPQPEAAPPPPPPAPPPTQTEAPPPQAPPSLVVAPESTPGPPEQPVPAPGVIPQPNSPAND